MEQKNLTTKKGLVHIHIYYEKQLDYFIKALKILKNFDCDIYITYINLSQNALKKLGFFTNNLIKVLNKGFDIFPFIQILNMVDLKNYFWLLKLHTKGSRNCLIELAGHKYFGFGWRNMLVESLIPNKKTFEKNILLLENSPEIGIVTAENLIMQFSKEPDDKKERIIEDFRQTCNLLNLPFSDNVQYPSGTMFLARADIFNKLKELNLKEDFFADKKETSAMTISRAASIERMIGYLALLQNKKLQGVINPKTILTEGIKAFFAELIFIKIFSIKNKYRNHIKYKILTILGVEMVLNKKSM